MNQAILSIASAGVVAAALSPASFAMAAKPAAVTVAADGPTTIATAALPHVSATITVRLASAAEAVATRATRCSGGRVACSLVDRLSISVNGRAVAVPPRALLLLADVDDGWLRRLGRDRYELILTCGDAAPAYEARLFFTGRRVQRLNLWSDEAGMTEQRTTFRDVDRAFR